MEPEDVLRHWVRISVAAEILGVTPRTMQDLVRRGLVPSRRLPNAMNRVHLEEVRKILLNQTEGREAASSEHPAKPTQPGFHP